MRIDERHEEEVKRIQQKYADLWKCECVSTMLVRIDNQGRITYWHQCQTCGQKKQVAGSRLTEKQRASCGKYDDGISGRWYEKRQLKAEKMRAEIEDARQMALERRNTAWWSWYNRYLKTPEWRAKRLKVIGRAGGICEGCRDESASHVHHLTYDRAGDEMLFDLVALCRNCHQKLHPDKDF